MQFHSFYCLLIAPKAILSGARIIKLSADALFDYLDSSTLSR